MKRILLILLLCVLMTGFYSFALDSVEIKLHINLDETDEPVNVSGRAFALYEVPEQDGLHSGTTNTLERFLFTTEEKLKARFGDPLFTNKTNKDGVVYISGLKRATYLVRELGSGKDNFVVLPFLLNTQHPSVYPKLVGYQNGCIDIFVFEEGRDKPMAKVPFKLVRIDGDTIQDVFFSQGVFSLEGLSDLQSDSEGKIHLEGLVPGTYQLILLKEIEDYRLTTELLPFQIKVDQQGCSLVYVYFKSIKTEKPQPPKEKDPDLLPNTGSNGTAYGLPVVLILLGTLLRKDRKESRR